LYNNFKHQFYTHSSYKNIKIRGCHSEFLIADSQTTVAGHGRDRTSGARQWYRQTRQISLNRSWQVCLDKREDRTARTWCQGQDRRDRWAGDKRGTG
jgi:hypothetical protein